MNHFEDLWNESEILSSKLNDNRAEIDIVKSINKNIKDLVFIEDNAEKHYIFGAILFELSIISRTMNINSYSALDLILNQIKNKKDINQNKDHKEDEDEDI